MPSRKPNAADLPTLKARYQRHRRERRHKAANETFVHLRAAVCAQLAAELRAEKRAARGRA